MKNRIERKKKIERMRKNKYWKVKKKKDIIEMISTWNLSTIMTMKFLPTAIKMKIESKDFRIWRAAKKGKSVKSLRLTAKIYQVFHFDIVRNQIPKKKR